MTTLVLVRHAKSDWGDPGLDDHDRPLNDRGLHDAPHQARKLAETGFRPNAIIASTALRAATTADFFSGEFDVPVELDELLYGAPASQLLRAAAERGTEPGVERIIVVAHDPGMTVLAAQLSDGGIAHMPTCAVAVFEWDETDWDVATALDPASWTFSTPR